MLTDAQALEIAQATGSVTEVSQAFGVTRKRVEQLRARHKVGIPLLSRRCTGCRCDRPIEAFAVKHNGERGFTCSACRSRVRSAAKVRAANAQSVTRTCPACRVLKPRAEFGEGSRACFECRRARQTKSDAARAALEPLPIEARQWLQRSWHGVAQDQSVGDSGCANDQGSDAHGVQDHDELAAYLRELDARQDRLLAGYLARVNGSGGESRA